MLTYAALRAMSEKPDRRLRAARQIELESRRQARIQWAPWQAGSMRTAESGRGHHCLRPPRLA